ncbi:MAG TPA: hypothetical protein VN259_09830 [Xanthomonadales bacterium]|nr:hypothetical protein [Xanthomonadales bacterium]
MSIELFNIHYRASVGMPPMRLLCQGVDVAGEKLLWVDGLDVANPVVIPLASVRSLEWAGSFRELMVSDLDLAERVISEAQGEYSPTIMARMFVYMSQDPDLHVEEALDLAIKQSAELIVADENAGASFRRAAANTASFDLARA